MTTDPVGTTIEIEWNYSPPGYFEEPVILKRNGYSIEVSGGRIVARMTSEFFDSQHGLRERMRQELDNYFLGAQLVRRQTFEIQGGAIKRIWPDGRENITLVVQDLVMKMAVDNVDLVTTDRGRVIHDTRRQRIEKTKLLGELAARHAPTDETARKLLDSFKAAVEHPYTELVHLYEIWEILSKRFHGEGNFRSTLCISKSARRRLTQLANDEPLMQGRHRGKHAGSLRDATKDELDEARAIAQDMVIAYLRYIDGQSH